MAAATPPDVARARASGSSPVRNQGLALVLLVAVQFMLVLDSTIVAVAMPSIATDLGFAQEDLSWVTNAYLLLFGGFLMLGGRLADLMGRRQLFIISLVVFAVASVIGAVATTPWMMIAARGLQGLASAFAAPAALAMLLTVYPDGTPEEQARRGRAMGVYGAVSGAGGAAGMIFGGLLTDSLGWPSVFFVNVPIALVAALLALPLLPSTRPTARGGGFDLFGAATITLGLGLLVYVLVSAEREGWTSASTIGFGALSLVLIALFLVIESTVKQPLVPLGIFRRRTLRAANLVAALIPMAVIPAIFFLTLYTQLVRGYSPLMSGFALVPLALSVVVAATNVGRVLGRIGLRATTLIGTLLVMAGMIWAAQIDGGSYMVQQFGPEILIGLGGGTVWVTATVAATADAAPEEAGLASGLFNTSNQLGAALGLAILVSVASARTMQLTDAGSPIGEALTGGYRAALLGSVVFAALAAIVTVTQLPGKAAAQQQAAPAEAQPQPN